MPEPDSSPQQIFGELPAGAAYLDRPAAYVVVRDRDGLVAVVNEPVRGREKFWLLGGGMEDGESPDETVVREVREEVGRELRLLRELRPVVQWKDFGLPKGWCRLSARLFLGELIGEAVGGEHKLQWIDPVARQADFFYECHAWAAISR